VRLAWYLAFALVAGLPAACPGPAEAQERQAPRGREDAGIDARMLADLEILRDLELLRQLDLLRKLDEVRSERPARAGRTEEPGKP
jgi:hypothetical protein